MCVKTPFSACLSLCW